jgi:hypothetical protein
LSGVGDVYLEEEDELIDRFLRARDLCSGLIGELDPTSDGA